MRATIGATVEAFRFYVTPPDRRLLIGDSLPFDAAAERKFLLMMETSASYLEFGSGASTLWAAKLGAPTVSVESDRRFRDAVAEQILFSTEGSRQKNAPALLHADIGPTGPWGKPALPWLARPKKWSNYPHLPWTVLGEEFYADVILIDGRFRVACALALIFYQDDKPWTMLVDDYCGRPHYREIERYAHLVKMHGRMAEFKPMTGVDRSTVSEALRTFASDWR